MTMRVASLEAIQHLSKQYNLRPDKRSGQNFLICEEAVDQAVAAAGLSKNDTVLEIGPGFGTLTVALAARAGRVLAVEADRRFVPALGKLRSVHNNIEIIQGDIFRSWPDVAKSLGDLQYKLVANLPYNITSSVLRQFTETPPRPSVMVVMVQKEVAERIIAGPGALSLLGLSVQLYGDPEIIVRVDRDCFWPEPEVDSAIVRIVNIGRDAHGYISRLGQVGLTRFWQLAKIGFSARRKQLHNNLSAGLRMTTQEIQEMLGKVRISPSVRAQELSVEDWISLAIIDRVQSKSRN